MEYAFEHNCFFIKKFRDGNLRALECFYTATIDYAKAYVASRAWGVFYDNKRDDIIQTSYYKLWTHRMAIQDWGHMRAYLTKILKHEIVNEWRQWKLDHNSAKEILYLEGNSEDSTEIGEDFSGMLADAVKKLPPKMQKVIMLNFYAGKRTVEVAEIMGSRRQTILNLRSLAIKKLRKMLPESAAKSNFQLQILS